MSKDRFETITVNFQGDDITVEGNYEPGEPMVMYHSDMSGSPGTPPWFEITKIENGYGEDITDEYDDMLYEIGELVIDQIDNR